MDPKAIGRSYDTIADRFREPGLQSYGMLQLQRAIQFTKNHRFALDIGCGSSGRFIDLLITHGFQPEGIDVSENMIALARQKHPNLLFHHQDICTWNFPRRYDFISAWDSTWHLPLAQQEPV